MPSTPTLLRHQPYCQRLRLTHPVTRLGDPALVPGKTFAAGRNVRSRHEVSLARRATTTSVGTGHGSCSPQPSRSCAVPCDPADPDACREHQFCEKPPGVCDRADVRGTCVDVPNGCPDVYEPVCGCDGMTYSNDCDRRAAGVSKAHDGPCNECRDACDCSPRPFPEPCAALCPTCDNWWTCPWRPARSGPAGARSTI